MTYGDVAEREFNKLTEAQQGTILELMVLFNQKNDSQPTTAMPGKRDFPFGILKDGHEYMADDFDDTRASTHGGCVRFR